MLTNPTTSLVERVLDIPHDADPSVKAVIAASMALRAVISDLPERFHRPHERLFLRLQLDSLNAIHAMRGLANAADEVIA